MADITYLQSIGINSTANLSSFSVAFPSGTANASYLVAWVLSQTALPTNITDTLGNTWELVASTGVVLAIYQVRKNKAGGGANTVTVNFPSAQSFVDIVFAEYANQSNGNPFDNAGTFVDSGSSAPNWTGSSQTPTFEHEVLIMPSFWDGNGSPFQPPAIPAFQNGRLFQPGGFGEAMLLDSIGSSLPHGTSFTPVTTFNTGGGRIIGQPLLVKSTSSQAFSPTFSPVAGSYTGAQHITLTTLTPGATIYYTKDGTTPTTSSPVYSGPILLNHNGTVTIKAIAAGGGFDVSDVSSAAYTLSGVKSSRSTRSK